MPSDTHHTGEVIESRTTGFRAQARVLHGAPALGALVQVEAQPVAYAIVTQVETGSIDVGRRPMAYGLTVEELEAQQPQIFELLKTEFDALLVGYRVDEQVWHGLPPHPPRLHSFVCPCGPDEVRSFTADLDFLRLLAHAEVGHLDELLLAVARLAIGAHAHDPGYVTRIGQEISRLVGSDYDRLRSIVRRLSRSVDSGR